MLRWKMKTTDLKLTILHPAIVVQIGAFGYIKPCVSFGTLMKADDHYRILHPDEYIDNISTYTMCAPSGEWVGADCYTYHVKGMQCIDTSRDQNNSEIANTIGELSAALDPFIIRGTDRKSNLYRANMISYANYAIQPRTMVAVLKQKLIFDFTLWIANNITFDIDEVKDTQQYMLYHINRAMDKLEAAISGIGTDTLCMVRLPCMFCVCIYIDSDVAGDKLPTTIIQYGKDKDVLQ